MSTIILDCDGVLFDFAGAICRYYNLPNPKYYDDFPSVDLEKIYDKADFLRTVSIYEGADRFVNSLRGVGDIVLATHATPHVLWQKKRIEDAQRHFGSHVVFTNNKERISGDILVEDSWKNIDRAVKESKMDVLWLYRPWSLHAGDKVTENPRIRKIDMTADQHRPDYKLIRETLLEMVRSQNAR